MAAREARRVAAWIAGLFATVVAGQVLADTKPSPTEQLVLAEGYTARMQSAATRVRHMLDNARKDKDVVKTVCLSDKLMQLETSLKSARERVSSLRGAIARGDTDVRNHEFSVLGTLKARSDRLETEANACVGEKFPIGKDGTEVTVKIDPNIATVDPNVGAAGGVIIAPPAPASGYK